MNEETEVVAKQHWFKGYKDYWSGIGVLILVYSVVSGVFDTRGTGIVLGIILSLIFVPIFLSIISGIILLIAWVFKRNFTFQRFLNILSTVAFLSLLFKIIALLK